MSALDSRDAELLAKILGGLGSDHDGEVAAAGAMATRFIRERGLSWPDVLKPRAPKPRFPASATNWRWLAQEILVFHEEYGVLTDWESDFVSSLAAQSRPPTTKQCKVLHRLGAKFGFAA
jgi:hypothetical protein